MWIFMVSRFKSTPTERRTARLLYLVVSFALLYLTSAMAIIDAVAIYKILFSVVPGDVENGWVIIERVFRELYFESEVVLTASVLITDAVMVCRVHAPSRMSR
jgi:hypothetical protein